MRLLEMIESTHKGDADMSTAHLYLFSDACPSDWLEDGEDERWHTIANIVFQSDPNLQTQIDKQMQIDRHTAHDVILSQDKLYTDFITDLEAKLPYRRLQKWKSRGTYKSSLCRAFATIQPKYAMPIVSACSFQEKTLRASKEALKQSYNRLIGGVEGRGIGFEEFKDDKGRLQMKHSFVNFRGYHEIQAPENQMLVLLFMAYFIADQYIFHRKELTRNEHYGFDHLEMTVVSDKLSGDNNLYPKNEQNLQNLIDPEGESAPLTLTRSPQSNTYSGELLADNLAGWLNAAISERTGSFAQHIKNSPSSIWNGWHMLCTSVDKLESTPALSLILNGSERE